MSKKQKPLSFFETWSIGLIYLPVAIASLFFAVRYRSLTVPLIANPKILLSGLASFSKADFLNSVQSKAVKQLILPFVKVTKQSSADATLQNALKAMTEHKLQLPIVAKPDLGYRGVGVQKVESEQQLLAYIEHLPAGANFLLQQLASYRPEAGVFYVRYPNQKMGRVVSIGLKQNPTVVGDGKSTLAELIDADPRCYALRDRYRSKHQSNLQTVLADGEQLELLFTSSHQEGSIFTNGNQYITKELTQAIDTIMQGFDEMYYGRLDVKYDTIDNLKAGQNLEIIEINGASSESLHIWDKDTKYTHAMKTLINQYRTLFKIGAQNRKRGYRVPKFSELLKVLKNDRRLIKSYPQSQ